MVLFLGVGALALVALRHLTPEAPPSLALERATSADRQGELSGSVSSPGFREPALGDDGPRLEDQPEAVAPDPTTGALRIQVVDERGEPLPDAVTLVERSQEGVTGYAADGAGWIQVPLENAGEVHRVVAPGFVPSFLHGLRRGERVVLVEAIRVEVDVAGGWQRLNEGIPGMRIKGHFEGHLHRETVGPLAESPRVELRYPDGSRRSVERKKLVGVPVVPISAHGHATFRVAEPGQYEFTIVFSLTFEGSATSWRAAISTEPAIEVRADEPGAAFQVDIDRETLDATLTSISDLRDD